MKSSLLRSVILLCVFSVGACTSQEGARIELPNEAELVITSELVPWKQDLLKRVEILAADSLEGRAFGTKGGELARRYLLGEFDRLGMDLLEGKRLQSFSISSKDGANIVGEIRSATLTDSAKLVLIGAHYDHEGIKGGKIFNGADDNASGSSLLLAIADTLIKSKLTDIRFLFVAFDAEEKGLVGARKFVETNPELISELDLMINFDMVSISAEEELYVAGRHHYPQLKSLTDSLKEMAEYKLLFGHDVSGGAKQDWTFSSDHGPFHRAKVPFLYFGVEDHEHYHQPTDKYQVINSKFYISVADSFRQLLPKIESLL